MGSYYSINIQRLSETFFGDKPNRGITTSALRRAVERYAAALSYDEADPVGLPAELAPYLNKIVRHAYKITDEDIVCLKQHGYSEDALFEITISVALGAGRVRLEAGLAALNGEAGTEAKIPLTEANNAS